jgi:hypothetical protein
MKTTAELFSIQNTYFPGHGMGGYGIYLNKNILIDRRLYKIKKVKTNRNGDETYLCSAIPEKTHLQRTDHIVNFEVIPRFGFIHQGIGRGKEDIGEVILSYRKPWNDGHGIYDETIIFKKDHLVSLLQGLREYIRFSFLGGRELEGDVNAEGKVLSNKQFTSMDVLIAEKAFDYAFKNIDSFEVKK